MATIPVPRTWVFGENVNDSYLNSELRDALNFLLTGKPVCVLRRTAAQSIANATTISILWDNEDRDTDNGHSTVTNVGRYTCQTAGFYRVSMSVDYAANATGPRGASVRVNGSTIYSLAMCGNGGSGVDTIVNASAVIPRLMAVGDYFELLAYQASGGSLNISGTGDSYGAFEWLTP